MICQALFYIFQKKGMKLVKVIDNILYDGDSDESKTLLQNVKPLVSQPTFKMERFAKD